MLQDIEQGNHDDYICEKYCRKYKRDFDQELLKCQFKGNKSKIQSLLQKEASSQFRSNVDYLLSKMLSKIEDLEVNLSELKIAQKKSSTEISELKASIKNSATESKDMSTQTEQS